MIENQLPFLHVTMRASNKHKWFSLEKATKKVNSSDPPLAPRSSNGKPRHEEPKGNGNEDPPLEVRVRQAAPPDPELLSKIGCRCLVIDLPGVLHENLKVDYVRGFVRVEGRRSVGRIKSFRKKYPLNHEQVVTKMLSAFLCQGVLVIVAPTKVAASMAVAAMIAHQLLMKGYSPSKRAAPKQRLMLMSHPASEGPVKFSSDMRATVGASANDVIGYRPSAFEPYHSSRSLPFDEPLDLKENEDTASRPSSFSVAVKNVSTVLGRQPRPGHLPNQLKPRPVHLKDALPTKAGHEVERSVPRVNHQDYDRRGTSADRFVRETSTPATPKNAAGSPKLQEYIQDTKKQSILSQVRRGTESSTFSYGELDHPVVWSDDSLRDEPSVSGTNSRQIIEGSYIDNFRDEHTLSPILEHQVFQEDKNYWQISPDNTQSSDRPLNWVQFDSTWQDKEESLMVDTVENQRLVEQFQYGRRKVEGTAATIGVPIMLPFEDELVNREDQTSSRMELEPNPQWRSAPFLPRISSPLSNSHLTTIDDVRTEYRGPVLPFREHRRADHRNTAPSPSLRRKTSSPCKKTVTWMDEI